MGASGVPHEVQKDWPGSASSPQDEHGAGRGDPHCPQNRAPSGAGNAQERHVTSMSRMVTSAGNDR